MAYRQKVSRAQEAARWRNDQDTALNVAFYHVLLRIGLVFIHLSWQALDGDLFAVRTASGVSLWSYEELEA